jgi:hypothetical protein
MTDKSVPPKFTSPLKCGLCQNTAPMKIVADYSTVREYSDEAADITWDAGTLYELAQCPACDGVVLRSAFWHSGSMDPGDIDYEILYPTIEKGLRGLPPTIESGYKAAQRVRNIDANAYGVLLGRVLDAVCADRRASGETLDQRLRSLAQNGEIPAKLVDVASGLRRLRNIAAHANLGELTPAELPVLDDLTRAILEYVYSAPALANEAQRRFEQVRQRPSTGHSDEAE